MPKVALHNKTTLLQVPPDDGGQPPALLLLVSTHWENTQIGRVRKSLKAARNLASNKGVFRGLPVFHQTSTTQSPTLKACDEPKLLQPEGHMSPDVPFQFLLRGIVATACAILTIQSLHLRVGIEASGLKTVRACSSSPLNHFNRIHQRQKSFFFC